MAAVPFHISTQLTDGNKAPAPLLVHATCASGLIADIEVFVADYLNALDAVTSSVITSAQVVLDQDLTGFKGSPTTGFGNGYGAKWRMATAVPRERETIWVPNFFPAGYEAAHPTIVNQTDGAAAQAFAALLLATTSTTTFNDEDGRPLTAVVSAVKTERKFRRALVRSK